jgi:hypothetical protein
MQQTINRSTTMPRSSQQQSQSLHRPALVARLHEAIRRKHVTVREVKVRKPVELHFKAEDECAICLDPLTKSNLAITPCGHKFCFSCIAENLNVSKTCPMCRTRIAPDAKKKEITDDDFGDIVYQNFDEAADIIGWSPAIEVSDSDSESDSESDSGSAGFPEEPAPLLRTDGHDSPASGEGVGIDHDSTSASSSSSGDDDSDDSYGSSDDSSEDSFSMQHNELVQEFAREHLNGLSPQETITKVNEFSKMLSFAMHVASDLVEFYEK